MKYVRQCVPKSHGFFGGEYSKGVNGCSLAKKSDGDRLRNTFGDPPPSHINSSENMGISMISNCSGGGCSISVIKLLTSLKKVPSVILPLYELTGASTVDTDVSTKFLGFLPGLGYALPTSGNFSGSTYKQGSKRTGSL